MTEEQDLLTLDAEIDRAFQLRSAGADAPVTNRQPEILDRLVRLNELEWPDDGIPVRIAAFLVASLASQQRLEGTNAATGPAGSKWQSTPRQRRSIKVGLALAVATLVAVSIALIAVSPTATKRSPARATATPGQFRFAGYYSVPDFQQTGLGGSAGPLTCPTVGLCYLVNGQPTLNSPGQPQVTLTNLSESTDDGSTWHAVEATGVSSFTTGIECPDGDGQVCLAGGTEGSASLLLMTTDAGATWSGRPLPDSGHLSSLVCSSDTQCVGIVTGSQDLFARGGITFVTSDGGSSWSQSDTDGAPLQLLACSGTTCLGSGQVPSQVPGASSVSVNLYSHDGGVTWSPMNVPSGFHFLDGSLQSIGCADQALCFGIGGITGTDGHTDTNAVIRSDDGGANWTTITGLNGAYLNAVSCSSVQACWMGGGSEGGFSVHPNADGSSTLSSSGPLFYSSTDGGLTWKPTAVVPPTQIPKGAAPDSFVAIGQISCSSGDVCVALGSGDVGANSTATYTNRSSGSASSQ